MHHLTSSPTGNATPDPMSPLEHDGPRVRAGLPRDGGSCRLASIPPFFRIDHRPPKNWHRGRRVSSARRGRTYATELPPGGKRRPNAARRIGAAISPSRYQAPRSDACSTAGFVGVLSRSVERPPPASSTLPRCWKRSWSDNRRRQGGADGIER